MSKVAGRQSYFAIKDAASGGGTLRNLSDHITSVDFPQEVSALEVTGLSDTDRKYIVGLGSTSISISGFWDDASNNVDAVFAAILKAADVDWEYGPEGSTAGKRKYSGDCMVTRYSVSSPVDGVVSFSADIQVSGAVTRGTF